MGCRAIEKSRKWDVAQLKSRANGMSRYREVVQMGYRAVEMSRIWTVAQMGCRAIEMSRRWDIAQKNVAQMMWTRYGYFIKHQKFLNWSYVWLWKWGPLNHPCAGSIEPHLLMVNYWTPPLYFNTNLNLKFKSNSCALRDLWIYTNVLI